MTDVDVCVVGAGYAGLAAARRLRRAGVTVAVVEARDRVGGRVWTDEVDGRRLDMGGTFIGPGQEAVRGLAAELGVGLQPTFADGDPVLVMDGEVRRYKGFVPRMNPIAVASLALGLARLDAKARKVSLDTPWEGRRAAALDAIPAGAWVRTHVRSGQARDLIEATIRGLMTCDPDEVSLLHFLYLVHSAGGVQRLVTIKGGYQQDHVVGGAQTMADMIAADLGDSLCLASPVRALTTDDEGVTVAAEAVTVRAGRAVVAVPPRLAADIDFAPALAPDRAELLRRLPAGSVRKTLLVYPRPFWRDDGLRAESAAPLSYVESTLDVSPASGDYALLACFSFGPMAERLGELDDDGRRRAVLGEMVARFGPGAAEPVQYIEHDWADEMWSRGCFMGHMAPGVLTRVGHVLRQPSGRIHWAGTETATSFHGTIDGAIQSGYRAAEELLALA